MPRDDEIFAEALDLPRNERAAFLERACSGDEALLRRLNDLFAGHDASGEFLERAAVERIDTLPSEKPGDSIDRYTLRREIGHGGCGVVYLADQFTPVRRQVALKVIKLGMDTRDVITRFSAERQALALMDHADIARVFDAGATAAGRPYFVMEFVDGAPITTFCDQHKLSVKTRLTLFVRVCQALKHAHQKGIIHRDIKPSNILVAMRDGVPTPKIIDFGIAKATQGRLTEQTLLTQKDQFIGTPAYMSPEQAELRELDIDTRSDIYALGIVLYELLTGLPAYHQDSLMRSGIDEVRRIIREVDPPRPSTRVSQLSAVELNTIANQRSASNSQLKPALRGDLDWIVMRCLEKDRDRRYASAQELAEDVQRHLANEPVEARPPETVYLVQKFVARHRVACASAAAIAAALIIGTVVSVRQAVRATRAEQVARAERDAATAAGRAEALARTDAQRRQEQAEDLLTFMLGDFRTELQKIGRLELLDAVGGKAMDYFAELDSRDLTDTALARQSKALTQIGEIRMDQARYEDAHTAFAAAYERAAALATRYPNNGDMLFERAQAEFWIGFVARRRGEAAAERAWLTRYRDSTAELVALEGKTTRAQIELTHGFHNLAVLEFDRGYLEKARDGFLEEKKALEELLNATPRNNQFRSRLADIASWLGSIAERQGDFASAIKHFSEMTAQATELVRLEPAVARWRFELAQSVTFTGDIQAVTNRREEAHASYKRASEILTELTQQDTDNRQWKISVLGVVLKQISLSMPDGDRAQLSGVLMSAIQGLEGLVAEEPTSQTFARELAKAWRLAGRLSLPEEPEKAKHALSQAIELGEPLLLKSGSGRRLLAECTQTRLLTGRLARLVGHEQDAQHHWTRVLQIIGQQLETTRDWQLLDPAAQALVLMGNPEAARPLLARLENHGYHALDPWAFSILDGAKSPSTSP